MITADNELALQILANKFKQLKEFDIIDLYDGEKRSPGIVVEIYRDRNAFKFIPLDPGSVSQLLWDKQLAESYEIKLNSLTTGDKVTIMWNNVTQR